MHLPIFVDDKRLVRRPANVQIHVAVFSFESLEDTGVLVANHRLAVLEGKVGLLEQEVEHLGDVRPTVVQMDPCLGQARYGRYQVCLNLVKS